MEEDYMMESQDLNEISRISENGSVGDMSKEFDYDESYEVDDGSNGFRNSRGRVNFSRGRGRGPPPGWGGPPPPMRFRGRGYGPGGPPMRGRGFFRGRGGPRYGNNGPNFDNSWGPPPGMMGGPPPFGPPPGMMPPMGPPPNMMQPPPYGAPPGMPPNMQGPELWVETKSEDGKSYFYHSRTRETTWTRPQEGPAVKVVTQSEMEAMALAGQLPGQIQMAVMGPMGGMSGPMGGPPMGGPMGGPMSGPPPMGMMPPNGMMGGIMPPNSAHGGLPSFMSQPPPWVNKDVALEKCIEIDDNSDNEDIPPGESMPKPAPPNGSLSNLPNSAITPITGGQFPPGGAGGQFPTGAAPQFPGPPGGHGGQFPGSAGGPGGQYSGATGGPGGQFPGAAGGAAPWGAPWQNWPPPMMGQPNSVNNARATPMNPTLLTEVIHIQDPPELPPPKKEDTVIPPELLAQASEWSSHHAPDGRPYYYHAKLQESVWEKPKPLVQVERLQAIITAEKAEKLKESKEIDEKAEVIDVDAYEEAAAAAVAATAATEAAAAQSVLDRQREEQRERDAKREQENKEKQEKEKQEKDKQKQQDRSRPISSTPISGTPWCVVWTGDGRVFFYNPTAHCSVWERPAQLVGRGDVDRALQEPPAVLRKDAALATAKANGDLKRTADSTSVEPDTDPAKKQKSEETKKPMSTKIDAGQEAAIEAEVRAARERAVVPLEQRMATFRGMLEERDVSAFSTWEKELHKIVFDCRYLLLTSKERKQVFDKYVRERAEEERKEKKNRLQQKKTNFRTLMEEAKLHSKSSYTEFSSKHGRDERFKAIDKPRDRETYFNEYLTEVRKKEKEDKERKREQAKNEFIELLKEKSVDRHARWADVKKKIDGEARYKAVESGVLREDYFRDYCRIVKQQKRKSKDEKEKEKDRDRSKKDKKDKDRTKEKVKDKDVKKEKKKEKGDKLEADDEPKQPTPPPDQWADIIGVPDGEKKRKEKKATTSDKSISKSDKNKKDAESSESEKDAVSPKQLRSSKKELPTPEKKSPIKSPPIKSPPKKRRDDFKSPEVEQEKKKVERKSRKKSEKD